MSVQSEIAYLQARLFREAEAIYLGLQSLEDDERLRIVTERNQQMHQTVEQLQAHIGREKTTKIICEAYDAQYQAWYRESEPLRLQVLERWNRAWKEQK